MLNPYQIDLHLIKIRPTLKVGLKQYEIMRMTDPDIQDQINYMLDDIFYDPESDQLMCSVTVQGGDVDVRPFDEVYKEQE